MSTAIRTQRRYNHRTMGCDHHIQDEEDEEKLDGLEMEEEE